MEIKIVDTEDKKQVKDFIRVQEDIYQTIEQWVPPLQGEIEKKLDRRHNPFYQHSDAVFILACDVNDRAIGRLTVLENRRYNEFNHEKTAFFTLLECVKDAEVAKGLFQEGARWAHERGLTKIIGPKGFTALDGLGLLVEGFEYRPAFGIPYNPDFYPNLVEGVGFQKTSDIVSGHMYSEKQFPEKIHELSRIIQEKRGLRVARFKHRKDLLTLVPKLQALYNGALDGTSGNVPLTDDETRLMANQILWFADPKFIKILMKDDEPVGFLFGYPDISEAVQRQKGRIFPFGWVDMLLEMKRTRWININGTGIIEQYRGLGGTAILFSEMYKSVLEGHFEHADIVQIGNDNERMQNELKNIGIDFYKVHRMYEMKL
jgi:hypothetical protein